MERAELAIEGPYALRETLFSGQAFRWKRIRGGFQGFVANHPTRLKPTKGALQIEWAGAGDAAHAVGRYLRTADPLDEIYGGWRADGRLTQASARWRGLHLLAQDPFETTISFIASSASNIPKIARSIEKMSARYGKPAKAWRSTMFSFPTARALARADAAGLRACELGYRARYVKAAAKAVAEGEVDLEAVAGMPTMEAQRAMVEGLEGVGPKVAACALLFSMGKDDAFPVDRWVQRCVGDWYFGGKPLAAKRCEEWGRAHFGSSAGYAQQYLFHDARAEARARSAGALRSRR